MESSSAITVVIKDIICGTRIIIITSCSRSLTRHTSTVTVTIFHIICRIRVAIITSRSRSRATALPFQARNLTPEVRVLPALQLQIPNGKTRWFIQIIANFLYMCLSRSSSPRRSTPRRQPRRHAHQDYIAGISSIVASILLERIRLVIASTFIKIIITHGVNIIYQPNPILPPVLVWSIPDVMKSINGQNLSPSLQLCGKLLYKKRISSPITIKATDTF